MRRSSHGRRAVAATAAILVFHVQPAAAHAFGQRYDLPIPLSFYLAGAGLAVALSFLVAAVVLRAPLGSNGHGLTLAWLAPGPAHFRARLARAGLTVAQAFGLAGFTLCIAAGFLGVQDAFRNIAPTVVWVIWWIGLAYASALIGDVWWAINPFRSIGAGIDRLRRRPPLRYPAWLGAAPALVLFAAFAWTEMISDMADSPAGLASLMLAYGGITILGMVAFGARDWLRNGEAFTVAFGLIARFGPFAVGGGADSEEGARLHVRPYGAGLLSREPVHVSTMLFVLLMLASVSFDGFRETPAWAGVIDWVAKTPALRGALLEIRGAGIDLLGFLQTMGLLIAFGAFALAYRLFAWLMARAAGGEVAPERVARHFVLTLMPIAIAYHLAHYLSYFMLAGQLAIPLISDPFGFGWNLFGTAGYRMDISVVDAKLVWYVAVAAIVAGHVAAVWLSHITALWVYSDAKRALASQYPMLILMVGYTASSLWILAQPVVEVGMGG